MSRPARCPYCSLENPFGSAAFCPRCGALMRPRRPSEELADRLSILRHVVRSRLTHHATVHGQLKRQIEACQLLLDDPIAAADNAVSLAWFTLDLLALESDPNVVATLAVLKSALALGEAANLESQPVADWEAVGQLRERLKIVRNGLVAADRELASGKGTAKRLHTAITALAKRADVPESFLHECICRTPVHWPRAATLLEPERKPEFLWDYSVQKARTAVREQNIGIARTKLQEVLDAAPAHVGALECLAAAALKTGDAPAAVDAYQRAVRAGTDNPLTFNNLAWFTCTTGAPTALDIEDVFPFARQAVELLPTASQWDTLAEVYERLDRIEEAIAATRRALEDDPTKDAVAERARRLAEKWNDRHRAKLPASSPSTPEFEDEFELAVDLSPDESGNAPAVLDDSFDSHGPANTSGDVLHEFEDDDESEEAATLLEPPSATDDEILDSGDSGIELLDDLALGDAGDSGCALDLGNDSGLALDMDDDDADNASEVIALDMDDDGDDLVMFDEEEWEPAAATVRPSSTPPVAAASSTARGEFEAPEVDALDPVDCTVHAPPSGRPGDSFLVQVFAHLEQQADVVEARARRVDPEARWRNSTTLGTRIARGSRVDFELRMKHLEIDEPRQSLVWQGRPESVEFDVDIPEDALSRNTTGTLVVSQDAVPIGRIRFKFEVVGPGLHVTKAPVPTGEAVRFRKAFASYASPDRDKVLARVQMARAVGIECFQDVLDLEPGKRWERELYRRIDEADVMFLFWSAAARDSEWVAREWRYALERLGEESIVPVLVEGPPPATPPPELEHLHFNDGILYFMADR